MGETTKIQWCDHTFNPWRGCTKVHAGCGHCYAETQSKRNPGTLGIWGPNGTRVVAAESAWRQPLKWNRDAEQSGERRRVFCASLADVFEDWAGEIVDCHGDTVFEQTHNITRIRPATLNDVRRRLFDLIDATPHLDWMLLTKRPQNILEMWPTPPWSRCMQGDGHVSHDIIGGKCIKCDGGRRENVRLYTSVSDQNTFNQLAPLLLKCGNLVPVLGLSIEPLLGPILMPPEILRQLNHVIVGGESGPGARPCDVEWICSIVWQCKAAGVPVFVKQLGTRPRCNSVMDFPVGTRMRCPGHEADPCEQYAPILRDNKGGDLSEWPEDLRVREQPE